MKPKPKKEVEFGIYYDDDAYTFVTKYTYSDLNFSSSENRLINSYKKMAAVFDELEKLDRSKAYVITCNSTSVYYNLFDCINFCYEAVQPCVDKFKALQRSGLRIRPSRAADSSSIDSL